MPILTSCRHLSLSLVIDMIISRIEILLAFVCCNNWMFVKHLGLIFCNLLMDAVWVLFSSNICFSSKQIHRTHTCIHVFVLLDDTYIKRISYISKKPHTHSYIWAACNSSSYAYIWIEKVFYNFLSPRSKNNACYMFRSNYFFLRNICLMCLYCAFHVVDIVYFRYEICMFKMDLCFKFAWY